MLTVAEISRRTQALRRENIRLQREENTRKKPRQNTSSISGMFRDEMIRRQSINSCIVKSTGEPKRQMSMEDAIATAVKMRNRHGGIFHHYQCVHCGHWHIGKRNIKD